MRYVLLSLFLISCNNHSSSFSQQDPREIRGIDPAFTDQVTLFESLYGQSVGDVSIGFSPLNGKVIGQCGKWSNGYRQIKVAPAYWEIAESRAKIGLILHELGHCVLNREHMNSMHYYEGLHLVGQVPTSLMYPYNFFSSLYEDLDSYYYHELFNPTTQYLTSEKIINHEDKVVSLTIIEEKL
jgi:hypothetical protein